MWGLFGRNNPVIVQPRWARKMEQRIMATVKEQFDELKGVIGAIGTNVAALAPAIAKVNSETTSLLDKITTLQNTAQGDITAEQLQAVLDQAKAVATASGEAATALKAVDDLVPDEVKPEPAPQTDPPTGGDTPAST